MSKHVLVVDGLRPLHKQLKRLGAKLTVITESGRIKEEDSKLYDRIIALPKTAKEEWLDMALAIDRLDHIDAIGAYHERNQDIAALIAEKLNLGFHSLNTVNLVYNKYYMREKLSHIKLDKTKYAKINNKADITKFVDNFGYPIILKPVNGWASIGVSIIQNENDIVKAFEWFSANDHEYEMYIEQYIEGTEFSVEAFSEDGEHKILCITKKFKDLTHFVEIGHCLPVKIDPIIERRIVKYVKKILNSLGIMNGATHTEIILTDDNEPRIVETHTRLGGDMIPELINIASGIDIMELNARHTLGEKILSKIPELFNRDIHAAIWFTTPSAIGVLEKVEGIEEAKKIKGVKSIELLQKPGDMITGLQNSFTRTIYITAGAQSEEEAIHIVKSASKELSFLITCRS